METCIALEIVGLGDEGERVAMGGEECLMERGGPGQEQPVATLLVAVGQHFGLKSQFDSAWPPCLSTASL